MTKMSLDEARKNLTENIIQSARNSDGWPSEADDKVNNSNRLVIAAMADAHGEAWLGKINLHGSERHGGHPVMLKWDGSLVCNFECDFVAPNFDDELVQMIKERDDAEYTGATADCKRIEEIQNQITKIGGVHLFWT